MTPEEFQQSLSQSTAPIGLSPELEVLWHDARGDWDSAHRTVQAQTGSDAAWLHAYLHRKEGDLGNADYWYRRAGRERPQVSLEAEWQVLADAFTEN